MIYGKSATGYIPLQLLRFMAGLIAASNFSNLFGDEERSNRYKHTAEKIKSGILKHLWDEGEQRFVRGLYMEDGEWVKDMTLESSVYGIFEFGVLPADDPRVVSTMKANKAGLMIKTEVGGSARYHHDYYFQRSTDIEKVPGNPWIICTLVDCRMGNRVRQNSC